MNSPLARATVCLWVLAMWGAASTAAAASRTFDGGIFVDTKDPEFTLGGSFTKLDPDGTSYNGSWEDLGQAFSESYKSTAAGAWARWAPALPAAGTYRVFLWWTKETNDAAARVEIVHDGKTETFTTNLQDGYSGWKSLGDFSFAAGSGQHLQITSSAAGLIVAEAKFLPVTALRDRPALPEYPPGDQPVRLVRNAHGGHYLDYRGRPLFPTYASVNNLFVRNGATNSVDALVESARRQNMNTVGFFIAWSQLEPVKGQFDYTVTDKWITACKANHLHAVVGWFGSYFNLASYRVPQLGLHRSASLGLEGRRHAGAVPVALRRGDARR